MQESRTCKVTYNDNSGIWTDYRYTSPEDQQKLILPLNRDSEKIYHNQRMIVDAKVETEPVAWLVSKIKRFVPNGIARFTLTQDKFDQHHDYIERDEFGKIIGMWADYYTDEVPLHDSNNTPIPFEKAEILHSGLKPELKVGGSYKTFTVQYSEGYQTQNYNWKFELDGKEINDDSIIKVIYPDLKNKLTENQIKVKFTGSDDYLNSILTIHCNNHADLNIKIVGM